MCKRTSTVELPLPYLKRPRSKPSGANGNCRCTPLPTPPSFITEGITGYKMVKRVDVSGSATKRKGGPNRESRYWRKRSRCGPPRALLPNGMFRIQNLQPSGAP
ncbi:hypothetical protein VTH06DRAFT_6697 [Thermothelomyces fergusii]